MSGELWKDVPDTDGVYQASSLGRIRRLASKGIDGRTLKPKMLRQSAFSTGYHSVTIRIGGIKSRYLVHRLVMSAFTGGMSDLHVNHIDGDKSNNSPSNLEWVTPAQNYQHALDTGLAPLGERSGRSKLTEGSVREIRSLYGSGSATCAQLAEKFGVWKGTISQIINLKTWKHLA